MKKKWGKFKRVCVVGGGLAVLVLIPLFAIWLTWALKLRNFERQEAALAPRVEEILRQASGIPAPEADSPRPDDTATTPTAPAKLETLRERGEDEWTAIMRDIFRNRKIDLAGLGYVRMVLPVASFAESGPDGTLTAGPEAGQRIREAAMLKLGADHYFLEKVSGERFTPDDPHLADLQRMLDDMEKLLMADRWQPPDFATLDPTIPMFKPRIDWLAPLTVIRSALHSPAEASPLLENSLKAIRAIHTSNFPEFLPLRNTQILLFTLASMDSPPAEGLSRAQDLLREARLTREQMAMLRKAYVARSAREIESQFVRSEEKYNWAERLAIRAELTGGMPIVMHAAMGWATGDARAWRLGRGVIAAGMTPLLLADSIIDEPGNLIHKPMELLRSLVNPVKNKDFAFYWTWPPEMGALEKDCPYNDELDFAGFVLAAARFRNSCGRYPERVEELIPEWLDEAYRPTAHSAWAILPMEQSVCPLVDNQYATDTFTQAVGRFRADRKRLPLSAEELMPYQDGPTTQTEAPPPVQRFATMDARPIFIHLRRQTFDKTYFDFRYRLTAGWNRHSYVSYYRPPLADGLEDAERIFTQSNEGDFVTIDAVWPEPELIPWNKLNALKR